MNNDKYSASAAAVAAVAATVSATATTASSPTPTPTAPTYHAAEAAALVGEHVPHGDVAAGGAALNSSASSFRRARSRSSAGALAALAALGGLSLDGSSSVGAPSSDGQHSASSSRPTTPMPLLADGGGDEAAAGATAAGGEGGGEAAAVSGRATSPKPTAAAAAEALSPPPTPSRPGAAAATTTTAAAAAAAAAKVQRPFSKLGAAAAALVARYVACPTRAAAAAERFASAARLVLHFDVNKTIVMTDGAQGAGAGCVVNMMLSECAWGRLEPGAEPPAKVEGKGEREEGGGASSAAAAAAAAAADDDDGGDDGDADVTAVGAGDEAKEPIEDDSVPPLPAPQVRWVAVGRLAADRPLADPQLMTYRSFLDSFALPSDASMPEAERERRRKARQDLKRRFTDRGQPGAMFSSVHAAVVDELSRAQAAACRDGDGEKKKCVERCVHGHHLLRPTVLPSFFNLLLHLQAQRRRFTLVLRSFGTDLPAVIDEINAFAEGRHPSYPGARLDGSDGRVDVRISEGRGHLGAFVRLSSRTDGTSLLLGAPRELLAAREYGPKDLLAAARATRGAKLLRSFGDIHAAVAGPPPWKENSRDEQEGDGGEQPAYSGNGIVSRALALRDYYPFWKASGERGRAGKLFLLDDGDGDDDDGAGDGGGGASTPPPPPLSATPPPPAAAAASSAAGGGEVRSNTASAPAPPAPPPPPPPAAAAKRDSTQVVHVFFDDNVGHGAANIVDARNVRTGAGIPFADVARAHLVRVEPLGAVLDPAFFVRAVHEAVLAASSSGGSGGSGGGGGGGGGGASSSLSSAAAANAAGCSSSVGGAPPADAVLLSPRPLRKLLSVSTEANPAAATPASKSSRESEDTGGGGGGGDGNASAAPLPTSSSAAAVAAAAAANATAAPEAPAAAALPGEYCHKCGKVHPPKASAAGGGGGVAGGAASSSSAALALAGNNQAGGGGGHHASARGKALWFLARARLMTVVRLGVAARLGGAVHETLEGSLTAASSSIGRGRSRSSGGSGLAQLLSEGKSIGEALAEKAEKERRNQV